MGKLPTGLSGRQVRTALERAGFDGGVIGRDPHSSRSEGWGMDDSPKRFGLVNPSPTLSYGKVRV